MKVRGHKIPILVSTLSNAVYLYPNSAMLSLPLPNIWQIIHALFSKDLVVPSEGKTVPDIVLLDSLHSLGAALLADVDRLDKWLDILLACQLQHGDHLWSIPNMASAHLRSIGCEILRHHRGQGLVGQADIVEFAVDVKGGHVFLDIEGVGHVSRIEDEIEFEGPFLSPVLFPCDDEFFSAHFQSIVLLARRVRKGVDFSAKGFGPENTKVTESTTKISQRECIRRSGSELTRQE